MAHVHTHSSIQDDHAIVCHPYMLACNGSIMYRLLHHLDWREGTKAVLDVGAGTGQMCRLLSAVPGIQLEACDIDPKAAEYFRVHPELRSIPFYLLDVVNQPLPRQYDAIVSRGVYHHIPKASRPKFLRTLCDRARVVIIADEGILEYSSPAERREHCDAWYGYVIGEAQREGLSYLAKSEQEYWSHERLDSADDGGDFKESPTDLIADAAEAGLQPIAIDRYGPWNECKGGFYTATFVATSQ